MGAGGSSGPTISKNKKGSVETEPLPRTLETCFLYNNIECRRKKCYYLHLCHDYVNGFCHLGKECPKSHNVLEDNVKDILKKHGINTKTTPKKITDALRMTIRKSQNKTDPDVLDIGSFLNKHGIKPNAKEIRDALHKTARDAKQNSKCESLETTLNPALRLPKNAILGLRHPSPDKCINAADTRTIEQSSKTTEQKRGEAEDERICYHHLRGKCRFKEKCINFHANLPYQWRYRLTSQKEWKPFPTDSNLTVEETFSDPQNPRCEIMMSDGERMKILFKYMIGSDGKKRYDIQRLSTSSSVKHPNHPLMTEWQWYWKSDKGTWNKYGSSDSTSTITDIEQFYQTNPVGQKILITSNHEYVLDFQQMVQCNLKFGTKRDMTRRPVFVSKYDVTNDQEEYKKIEKYFLDTFQKIVYIETIERIENGELWDSYISKRDKMSKKRAEKDIQERQLFHGTASDCIEVICRQGFDFRLSGQRGGASYGKGSYFATTSKYSDNYADLVGSEKRMFVVKALVGDYTQGEASFVRPPLKDPNDLCSPLYDSCVDNPNHPTIFVIFDFCQVYPEYLITYNPSLQYV